jgi:hypothetical protein
MNTHSWRLFARVGVPLLRRRETLAESPIRELADEALGLLRSPRLLRVVRGVGACAAGIVSRCFHFFVCGSWWFGSRVWKVGGGKSDRSCREVRGKQKFPVAAGWNREEGGQHALGRQKERSGKVRPRRRPRGKSDAHNFHPAQWEDFNPTANKSNTTTDKRQTTQFPPVARRDTSERDERIQVSKSSLPDRPVGQR